MNFCIKKHAGIFIVTLFSGLSLFSQVKDTTAVGSVKGSVKDTALNYFLQSASVTINRASDGTLIAYSMTNGLGEFSLKGIPTGLLLKISVSYVGYRTVSQSFRIPADNPCFNIGRIDLVKGTEHSEDSVIVTPPPVRMKGDTLEFSAAAFSLDKNAVAEDLLKKLPGVILWGDGTITVNGKQISKLLVDGKPFFGGDTKVATQNIPKSSIDKIQVYQEQLNIFDPLDSTSTINIKLRKNKQSGYFGALSAGGGTDGRYELGANNSLFSPRSQYALVGQGNNINKTAGDVGTLLRNNTYKGVGVRVEYQPDFSLQGRNQSSSGGFLYSHDFSPVYNDYEKNQLLVNSFINHNDNITIKNTQTVSYIGSQSALTQDNSDNLKSTIETRNLNGRYVKHKGENTLTLNGAYNDKKNSIQDSGRNEVRGSGGALISGDLEHDSSVNRSHAFDFKSSFDHNGFSTANTHKLTTWDITHSISIRSGKKDSAVQTDFTSVPDPLLNRSYDRRYDNDARTVNQTLSMRLGDFSSWLFSGNRRFAGFHIQLKNDLSYNIANQDNAIRDRDPLSKTYVINTYLTTNSRYTVLNEVPDLRLGKTFFNVLANRYQKELSLYADARAQLYNERNASTHKFQEFDNTYRQWIPSAGVEYTNFRYGELLDKYNLNFDLSYDYPTVDQRAALIDSSNIYSLRGGNLLLMPMKKYELSAKFRHDSYRLKNTFAYGAGLLGGIRDHYFADSAIIDQSGRYTYYTVNLNGNKYLTMNLFLNKAFVSNSHQVQISLISVAQLSRTPGYLQNAVDNKARLNTTDLFLNSDTLSVYYTLGDIFSANLIQSISYFRSRQKGLYSSVFANTQSISRLGIGVNFTKKFSLYSNVSYNSSVTSGSGAASYRFTLWNASALYRFLPANNLELKVSALDLLNQNKGVINYGNNLSYTHGTVNLLHQYFMMTLTYYPRKFGKK
ncbi:MAG: hypothetical protein JST68_01155 [Bacteroidetes bacterium]|nr:hypothetical protein [Bacteroidota bacterium]